jgi:hypothetical protein
MAGLPLHLHRLVARLLPKIHAQISIIMFARLFFLL